MKPRTGFCVIGLVVAMAAMGCQSTREQALQAKNRLLDMKNTELEKDAAGLKTLVKVANDDLAGKLRDITALTKERDELKQKLAQGDEAASRTTGKQQEIKTQLAAALKDQKCEVVSSGKNVAIRVNVGFTPGSVEIEKDGQKLLAAIAEAIAKSAPGSSLRVEGHTDDTPIMKAQFPSNWELSGSRAASVLRFLVERCNVSPERIAFGGYGECAPIVPNTDAKSRAQNRRIEIVVLAAE
jgi:flagellar motor protein MotB